MQYHIPKEVRQSFKKIWNHLNPGRRLPQNYERLIQRYAAAGGGSCLSDEVVLRLYGPLEADVHVWHYKGFAVMIRASPNEPPTVIRFLDMSAHQLRRTTLQIIKAAQKNQLNLDQLRFTEHALHRVTQRYQNDVSGIPSDLPVDLKALYLLALSAKELLRDDIFTKRTLSNKFERAEYYRFFQYRFVLIPETNPGSYRVVTFERVRGK